MMAYVPKILAFAGSARMGSFNDAIVRIAAEGARQAGAEVTVINLRDYPLPIFDQDIEAARGLPANARALKRQFIAHDGLLIASPEYNSSFTPLLKNTIDWVSRSSDGDKGLAAYEGKVAALISASPGALGGLRGLVHLRAVLGNIGVLVLPEQRAISSVGNLLGPDGRLKEEKDNEALSTIGRRLAETLAKLKG